MPRRKITSILLIVLALVMIVGGWWLWGILYSTGSVNESERQAELERLELIKEMAVYNVKDFLKTPKDPDSIWEDLLNNKQFASLQETKINISLDSVGNPQPFDSPGVAVPAKLK